MFQDVSNALIQTLMQPNLRGERVIMKIRGCLVDWLVYINPTAYGQSLSERTKVIISKFLKQYMLC